MKKKKKVAAGPRDTKNENTQNNENASNGKRDFDDKICCEEKMRKKAVFIDREINDEE